MDIFNELLDGRTENDVQNEIELAAILAVRRAAVRRRPSGVSWRGSLTPPGEEPGVGPRAQAKQAP